MAARKRKVRLDENWRARIQTSMLINRLQDHALGSIEMTQTQVRAVEVLLRKTAPDLSATTISGDPEKPLTIVAAESLRQAIRGENS